MTPDAKLPFPTTIEAPELEQHLVSSLLEAFAVRFSRDVTMRERTVRQGRAAILRAPHQGKAKNRRRYRLVRAKRRTGDLHVHLDEGVNGGETLESAVRRAIKVAIADAGARLALIDPTVLRIAELVGRTLPVTRQQLSETTIERLVDALVETQDPIAAVSAEIDASNAEARMRFMGEFATLNAEQVTTAAGSTARNRSQTASRWKADGKIFSIPWQGVERYPKFQFKDGRPLPVVADVLRALPEEMSAWETAFWFVSTNGWLDDAAPCERLGGSERVIEAARREGEVVVG